MSDIIDNVLHSREKWEGETTFTVRFVTRMLDMINQELSESGDRDWLVDCLDQASIKISHIENKSRRVASGLTRLGLGPGDILHTAYNSQLDFYWPVWGAWLCGATPSVADPALSVEVIRAQMLDTRAKVVVVSFEAVNNFLAANALLPEDCKIKHILVIDRDPWQSLPDGCSSFKALYNDDGSACPKSLPEFNADEIGIIHWTSGTTGKPKAVLHTQWYLHVMMRKSKLPPRTSSLQSNTLFHAGAFLLPFDGGIRNKFTCYFLKDTEFTGERLLKIIHDYKPAFYMAGPYHVQAMSCLDVGDFDLSSLFCIMPNGGMITTGAVKKLHAMCPNLKLVFSFYGSTETGSVSWTFDVTSGCLGALTPGNQAFIRDLGTGSRLGPGQDGEICVKTMTCMKGYLNNQEANREFFDENGFAHMGDIGYYDEDGKLYFKDRIKEVMRVTAKWFGPSEVEEAIELIDGVLEACVWSTFDKNIADDILHAAVVVKAGAKVTREMIIDYIRNNLPDHKHITGEIFFLDAIPHNPQGKKLRRILKKQHTDRKLISS